MKQILLERQGYSERIEKMFGKGMINKDVGICFLHISDIFTFNISIKPCLLYTNFYYAV